MSTIADHFGPASRPKAPRFTDLFDAPDQRALRQDLATFFGPKAEVYLDVYERMRGAEPRRRTATRTWSWPVFLGAFTWFFYRKMYLYGAMTIFMPMLLGYLFGGVGGSSGIVFVMWGKTWYVNHALSRIAKADELGLTGTDRADYLQRAGGVSWIAGILAGLVYGFLLLILIAGVMTRHKTHHG